MSSSSLESFYDEDLMHSVAIYDRAAYLDYLRSQGRVDPTQIDSLISFFLSNTQNPVVEQPSASKCIDPCSSFSLFLEEQSQWAPEELELDLTPGGWQSELPVLCAWVQPSTPTSNSQAETESGQESDFERWLPEELME